MNPIRSKEEPSPVTNMWMVRKTKKPPRRSGAALRGRDPDGVGACPRSAQGVRPLPNYFFAALRAVFFFVAFLARGTDPLLIAAWAAARRATGTR
ncbi:hypothetical protein Hhel01_03468 [Haloferula helveola]